MLELKTIKIGDITHSYKIFGSGSIDLVLEIALGATMGEWYHLAEKLSDKFTVLLYERSRDTAVLRTPENIARELHALLQKLGCAERIVIAAHSQGGLYAYQFVQLYPEMTRGLLLIDPLSPNDNSYKEVLDEKEQKKSGFDKSGNLVIMGKLAKLHLGFLCKAIMKNAPPFYYYSGFSQDARDYILSKISKPDIYAAAVEEYRLAHDDEYIKPLREKGARLSCPIVLITHTNEFSVREIIEFGRTDRAFAEKVENLWQSLMKDYLTYSDDTEYIQAKNSGHYIHLTEPELIFDGLDRILTR